MSITNKTAVEIAEMLKSKQCSSVEVTTEFLSKIEAKDKDYNAFITVTKEKALEQAKKADELLKIGNAPSPLTGVPMAVKDNISTKGILTTCASKMLGNYIPPFNATVMDKMEEAGMVLLGKLNMDEFAIGTSGESSFYGCTKNPWNADFTPGGSSSGAASAVASAETPVALGSDTGGSIRVPSAYCGVVGFKPTYGAVSRSGVVSVSSSFDQVGTLGRTVEDTALLYEIIKGYDKKDARSLNIAYEPAKSQFGKPLSGLKIGIIKEYLNAKCSAEVVDAVNSAVKELEKQGAQIVELSMPSLDKALAVYHIISSAEISSNMGRFDGTRFGFRAEDFNKNDYNDMFIKTRSHGFGAGVQRRIMTGTFVLKAENREAYYNRAKFVQTQIINEYDKLFSQCDIIVSPTTAETAFPANNQEYDVAKLYASDYLTVPVNIAGIPALSIPCGVGANNLPIGMQIIGKRFSEALLFGIAHEYEKLIGGFATLKVAGGDR